MKRRAMKAAAAAPAKAMKVMKKAAMKRRAMKAAAAAPAKAMKAMKKAAMKRRAMKAAAAAPAKAMKAMKTKAVSKIAKGRMSKVVVFRGSKAKTVGGLTQTDLVKNSRGKIVSKKASAHAKKIRYANIKGWIAAVTKARKALGVKGFVAVKKGSELYKKAKELYQ